MSNRKEEHIYLSAHREGDLFVVRDQDGRRLAGVVSMGFKKDIDEAVKLQLEVLDAPVTHDGSAHSGNK